VSTLTSDIDAYTGCGGIVHVASFGHCDVGVTKTSSKRVCGTESGGCVLDGV